MVINIFKITGFYWEPVYDPTWHNFSFVTRAEDFHIYLDYVAQARGATLIMTAVNSAEETVARHEMNTPGTPEPVHFEILWLRFLDIIHGNDLWL